MRERSMTGIAGVVFGVLSVISCSRPAGSSPSSGLEKPVLNVGLVSTTATYLPLYMAVDKGIFAREGLQVNLLTFRGGSDLIKALVAGSVDVGVVSLWEVSGAISAGQPLKAFYGGFNVPAFDWYAVPSIKTIADVKGKRIGVTQYGSSTDFLTRYALLSNGIDPVKDVQIIQGGDSPTRLAAMQAKQIDVNIFAAPDTFIAAAKGYHPILRQSDLAPDYPYHVFTTSESFLARNSKTLKALLRGHIQGVRLAKQNRKMALEVLGSHIQMDPQYLGPTYDSFINYLFEDGRLPSAKGLQAFFEMGMKAGRFEAPWPQEKYLIREYLDTYDQWKPAS
jgi:NitT/TauT family transport system substrate-binding protein